MSVVARLQQLGIQLPPVAKPVAAYVPAIRQGHWVFTSGQIPFVEGKLKYAGVVGADVSEEEAYDAARVCCLNALAAVQSVAGNLDKIENIVRVIGFVASAPGFTNQAKVMNGASELLAEIFGDAGKHARSAIGTSVLPLNAPVEVEMIVRLKA
ncbi:MAG: RidA family protein [Acidobacteriota bacterium]